MFISHTPIDSSFSDRQSPLLVETQRDDTFTVAEQPMERESKGIFLSLPLSSLSLPLPFSLLSLSLFLSSLIHSNMAAKNHATILPDADREATVNALVGAAFGAAGQRCMALSTAVFVGEAKVQYSLSLSLFLLFHFHSLLSSP